VVDSPFYVLGCYRYIELNPVRAGMVGAAVDYEWSSARDNCGYAISHLLAQHAEYSALGDDDALRRRAYRQLLELGDDPIALKGLRDATGSGLPLVGERLKAELQASGARLERGRPGPRAAKLPQ